MAAATCPLGKLGSAGFTTPGITGLGRFTTILTRKIYIKGSPEVNTLESTKRHELPLLRITRVITEIARTHTTGENTRASAEDIVTTGAGALWKIVSRYVSYTTSVLDFFRRIPIIGIRKHSPEAIKTSTLYRVNRGAIFSMM
jgi:hypothetical protein